MAAECLFCRIVAGLEPAHIVLDDPDGVAFLDIHPVFLGHTLLVPRTHVVTLGELPAADLAGYFGLAQRLSVAVPAALGATGSFVAMNNIVSQSVPHLHVHTVPRTKGDGLRGFFWPRTRYPSEDAAAETAARIRAQLS